MTDSDDALRARVARTDPLGRGDAAGLTTSLSAQEIRERAMTAIDETTTQEAPAARGRTPKVWLLGAAAALVAVVATVAALNLGGEDAVQPREQKTLALTTAAGDPMAMCMQITPEILRDVPVAFGGTVTAVAGTTVTVDVDRWYKGGDADVVTITNPDQSVALDGVEFKQNDQVLISATEGVVNICGMSGAATPDLQRLYDDAFAA